MLRSKLRLKFQIIRLNDMNFGHTHLSCGLLSVALLVVQLERKSVKGSGIFGRKRPILVFSCLLLECTVLKQLFYGWTRRDGHLSALEMPFHGLR